MKQKAPWVGPMYLLVVVRRILLWREVQQVQSMIRYRKVLEAPR